MCQNPRRGAKLVKVGERRDCVERGPEIPHGRRNKGGLEGGIGGASENRIAVSKSLGRKFDPFRKDGKNWELAGRKERKVDSLGSQRGQR